MSSRKEPSKSESDSNLNLLMNESHEAFQPQEYNGDINTLAAGLTIPLKPNSRESSLGTKLENLGLSKEIDNFLNSKTTDTNIIPVSQNTTPESNVPSLDENLSTIISQNQTPSQTTSGKEGNSNDSSEPQSENVPAQGTDSEPNNSVLPETANNILSKILNELHRTEDLNLTSLHNLQEPTNSTIPTETQNSSPVSLENGSTSRPRVAVGSHTLGQTTNSNPHIWNRIALRTRGLDPSKRVPKISCRRPSTLCTRKSLPGFEGHTKTIELSFFQSGSGGSFRLDDKNDRFHGFHFAPHVDNSEVHKDSIGARLDIGTTHIHLAIIAEWHRPSLRQDRDSLQQAALWKLRGLLRILYRIKQTHPNLRHLCTTIRIRFDNDTLSLASRDRFRLNLVKWNVVPMKKMFRSAYSGTVVLMSRGSLYPMEPLDKPFGASIPTRHSQTCRGIGKTQNHENCCIHGTADWCGKICRYREWRRGRKTGVEAYEEYVRKLAVLKENVIPAVAYGSSRQAVNYTGYDSDDEEKTGIQDKRGLSSHSISHSSDDDGGTNFSTNRYRRGTTANDPIVLDEEDGAYGSLDGETRGETRSRQVSTPSNAIVVESEDSIKDEVIQPYHGSAPSNAIVIDSEDEYSDDDDGRSVAHSQRSGSDTAITQLQAHIPSDADRMDVDSDAEALLLEGTRDVVMQSIETV
jgi:hypothetical protein